MVAVAGSDVLFELVYALVTVLVQLGEGLAHAESGQTCRRALVPALFHDFRYGGQNLTQKEYIQRKSMNHNNGGIAFDNQMTEVIWTAAATTVSQRFLLRCLL